ncbi:MAG TPA: polysaccharide biosynthesis tyrosine autokinase [Methylomirabilota bacterium]|nr:polysaccharide biosynthesis tyrosine autokinase [Methylomirabilota bacterium]
MAQYEMNLRDYWLIVRRRRFTIIWVTLVFVGVSFWFAKQKVPLYEATAAVKFEQSTSLSGLLVEVLSYSTADSIETQASLIKSYPILEEAARRMGKLPQTTRGEALRESKAYMAALDSIAGKVRTARIPSTSILEITATSSNPREARDLANTMAETYRDYNRSVRNARITEARKFIEAQLREVEGRVKRAEEEVWAFREANRIIAPGAESSVLLSLFTQLRSDIEKTRQQRTELELAQVRLARTDPASLAERVFVESSNPALQKLQATQVELLLERNNLALEVTSRHPRLQALEERMREVRSEMRREVAAQIALLRSREDILNRQMGELLQKNREVPAIELGLQRLQRDAKVNDDLLTLLKTKHQEALIKESEGIEEVMLVRPATEPASPVGAETFNMVIVGALLGLMLGLVVAFVQETLDTSIGTIEDVESYLQIPVLGIVPHIDARETMQRLIERRPALAGMEPDALQSHALLITHFDPKSPVAEAYRTLRTNIQFMRMERQGKLLVITSPTLQEGKTTTIVNLALTMAQNGQRTLLVGANLRRPSIHRFFGIEREPGLSDILVGNAQWRDCIRTVADILMGRFEMEDIMASPGLDNLHIIESGPVPANPSELLSTPAMGAFLREAREEYDIVLIDTPPVLPVTDSAIVAGQTDGVILVYQAGKVGRLVLKRAKAHLESARAKVWGVVLNDVQTEIAGYAYTHYYTHYYGEETPAEAPPGGVQRLWGSLRARLRGRRSTAGVAPPTAPSKPAAAKRENAGAASNVAGRRKSRSGLGSLLMLVGLVAVLFALVAWQMGWLARDRPPRELLRKRLEAPASVPAPLPPAPSVPPRPQSTVPADPRGDAVAPAVSPPPSVQATSPMPPALSAPPPSADAPAAPPAPSMVPVAPSARAMTRVAPPAPPMVPAAPPARAMRPAAPPAPPMVPAAPPARAMTPAARPAPPMTPAAPSAKALAPAAPSAKAITPATPSARATAPTLTPAPAAVPTPAETSAPARFAVEFGPFPTVTDAERMERQLNQVGHQTVRFRQQTGAAQYAVLIERVPSLAEAQALIATLQEQGFPEALVLGTGQPLSVRVGELMVLRGAVQLAERLRARGQQIRIAVQPGEAVTFVIRHGNFASRDDAEDRGQELTRLGLPNHVVRVR